MRYTTIIDIYNTPVWRSSSARLVYFYMCLKCGYHDDDRDIIHISLRELSVRLGLTLSAVRCALPLLISQGLITSSGVSAYKVTKWAEPKEITRRKTKREKEIARIDEVRQQEKAMEKAKREEEIKQAAGKSSYQLRIERLQAAAAKGDPAAAKQLEKVMKQEKDLELHKKAEEWRKQHKKAANVHDPAIDEAVKKALEDRK